MARGRMQPTSRSRPHLGNARSRAYCDNRGIGCSFALMALALVIGAAFDVHLRGSRPRRVLGHDFYKLRQCQRPESPTGRHIHSATDSTLLRHAYRSYRIGNQPAQCHQHINLPKPATISSAVCRFLPSILSSMLKPYFRRPSMGQMI